MDLLPIIGFSLLKLAINGLIVVWLQYDWRHGEFREKDYGLFVGLSRVVDFAGYFFIGYLIYIFWGDPLSFVLAVWLLVKWATSYADRKRMYRIISQNIVVVDCLLAVMVASVFFAQYMGRSNLFGVLLALAAINKISLMFYGGTTYASFVNVEEQYIPMDHLKMIILANIAGDVFLHGLWIGIITTWAIAPLIVYTVWFVCKYIFGLGISRRKSHWQTFKKYYIWDMLGLVLLVAYTVA